MFEKLKKQVCRANKDLVTHNLVLFTWGNASAIDRDAGIVAIKPSGVDYNALTPNDIVILDLDGKIIEGDLKPSSDAPTHLELYRNFDQIGAIVHTHSKYATAFAQAKMSIDCLGTTHADHFYGSVPVTRDLCEHEIKNDYEINTGVIIVDHFKKNDISPLDMPACLVASHGPFVWGATVNKAVYNSVVLEAVAEMKLNSLHLNPRIAIISNTLLDKHYQRKHGPNAYYGQK